MSDEEVELETLEISCQSCGSALMVPERMKTAQCPYCASSSIVRRPPSPDRPDPTFVLGFVVDHDRATELVETWIRKSRFFGRSDFRKASFELTRGVYLPAYLYSAVARTDYSAEIGENYTVTETYTTTDSKGRSVTRTRTRTKTEWRNLSGERAEYVNDVIVTASKGVSNRRLEEVEPFDLRALRRYRPAVISGWLAEEPSVNAERSLELAREESVEAIGARLGDFMPGDSHRGLEYTTLLEDEVIDLVLLPLWSFAASYHEDRKPVRILVNGQTGEVCGKVPLSAIKILLFALLCLLLVGLIVFIVAAGGR